MIKRPYHNPTRQSERRATLQNDRRVAEATTYHQLAVGEAEPVHGRFAEINKFSVTGATHRYPEQPSTSFYHHDPAGQERPLGFSVDEMQPVGEPFEIAASLGEANPGDVGQLHPQVADSASPDEEQRSDAGRKRR